MIKPKKVFWVVIPKRNPTGEGEWENVNSFNTRKQAEKFLFETWGIGKDYSDPFITEGEV